MGSGRAGRRRRPIVMLALAAVTAGSVGSASTAATDGAWPDAAAMATAFWPNVRPASGTELVTVHLADAAGRDLEDAVAIASLWPSLDVRRRLRPGDTFDLLPIDRVPLAEGRGTVHVADQALLAASTSSDGSVLVQLDVYTADGRTAVATFERRATDDGRWVDSAASPGAAPQVERRTLRDAQLVAPEHGAPAVVPGVELRHHQGALCSGIEYAGTSNVAETVVTTAVYRGIRATVTYTEDAETTSGLGAQLGSSAWQQSGTSTRRSTLSATFVTITGSTTGWTNKEFRANWQHFRYYRHCAETYGSGYVTQRFTEPNVVVGFPAIIDSRYPLPGCVDMQTLQGVATVSTTTAKAVTHLKAFKIAYGPAAFEGSAQSGYSAEVRVTFTNPTPGSYWYWCGDQSVPQQASRVRSGR